MAEAKGDNFDLQTQALKEFELKDVQELLKQLKTSDNLKLTEDILKKLDKDDNYLSETEKKLYEQSQEALNIVNFLEGLVKSLEKKEETKLTLFSKNNLSEGWSKNVDNSISNEKKEEKILENILGNNLNKDTLENKINNLDSSKTKDLLSLKIISESTCKSKEKYINKEHKQIKELLINKLQINITKQLEGANIDVKTLLESSQCNYNDFIKKVEKQIKDPKKVKDILGSISFIKENNTLNELKNILPKYSITKKDLEGKTLEEINKILTNKEVSEKDKKTILEKLNNLKVIKEARNISIEDIQNILSFGLEGYNYFSNEYYLENTSETIKISDKKKFLEVSKFLKENNKTLNFYNLSNPSFRTDFNLIKAFQEISGKKLNYFETKDIDFSKLNNKEKIELLNIVDEENLKTILVQNKEDIKNLNNKKYIEILNGILNNKALSEDLTYEEDNIKIDNSLSKLFKDNYKNALVIFEDLDYSSDKILELPKTKEVIFKNPKIINYFINQDFHFYDILSQKLQKNHNLKYIDSVLEKSDNKSRDLAKLQFSDIKNLLIAFNKIKKYSKINDPFLITKIIQRPIFKLTLKIFYTEQSDNIKNLKSQDKERLGEIMGEFKKYDEENKRFIKIYNESQIEKNIPKENINNNKDNIFSIKGKEIGNLIMTFSENGFDEIQSKIADIIKDYIKNPSNIKSIFNNEIASKLGEKKYKLFLKELKKIIDSYFSTPINDLTKEEKKGINDKYINKKTGEIIYKNFKIDYLEKLRNTKIKYQKNNQKFDEKEFTKKYVEENFPNLLEKNKVKLINKILYENIGEKKLNKTINNDILIKATVNGNQEYINKYLKNIDNNFYNYIDEEITEYKKQKLAETSTEKKDQYDRLKEISYPLNTETGVVTISENGKTDKITLTPAERLLVNKNPETLENIVDFYKTLDRIGLSKFWTIKEELFQTIGNKKGIGFKIDSDYLNENEIKIFLNSILKSIGENEISPVFKLDSFLSIIERKNNTQIGGKEAIVDNNLSETKLENKFFNKFVNRNSGIVGFNFSKFEQSI